MTTKGIKNLLKVQPFRAFVLRESSGESQRVVSLESIHIAEKLRLAILYPPDGSLVMLDPRQIASAADRPERPAKKSK